jgi:hypothetical protein
MTDYEVVWNGAHNHHGDDQLLPPREEQTSALWIPENWSVVGLVERILWEDRHGGSKGYQRTMGVSDSISVQVAEARYNLRGRHR